MKKTLQIAFLLTLSAQLSFSQDILKFRNGTELPVIVKEINPVDIKYKKFDNQDGPMVTVLKIEVASIKYANGTFEIIDTTASKVTPPIIEPKSTNNGYVQSIPSPDAQQQIYSQNPPPLTKEDYALMFERGTVDAKTYYRGYKGAGTGTFFAAFLAGPLLGLIPAVACSTTPPSRNSMGYPNYELAKDNNYTAGYNQEAKKIKVKKVWTNYGIGTAIILALLLVPGK